MRSSFDEDFWLAVGMIVCATLAYGVYDWLFEPKLDLRSTL
jgi:hypothetical protein